MAATASLKILVVDDEPDFPLLIRQTFKRRTSSSAWTFVFAGDGEEALDKLQADPEIDLVLTDINMPRMDGLTLLARINEMDRPLRVVIVSAYGDMANIRTAMNRGAFDFVLKPVGLDDLTRTIQKTVRVVEADREARETRRRLAQVQQALDVAQEMQALKARFFADLSHEFRTPLTLILGPLQDALQVDSEDGEAARPLSGEQIAVMQRHALRLKHLIDQMLDLSKLEAGRMTLRAGPHDVVPFLRDLVQAFVPAAERKQLALRFMAPDEAATVLYFEPDKLEKVVANLLSNAIKFTPERGTVRVSVQPFEETHLDIVVRDSGPGIPAGELPHIFERFHRSAHTHRLPGTGIGLSLAKELVALHGGSLFVESEEGFGATFTVRLRRGKAHLAESDLAEEEEQEEALAESETDAAGQPVVLPDMRTHTSSTSGRSASPDAQAPHVLVVEDNADVRAYIRRHLAARYHVVEAEDGAEGLEKMRAAPPDLVISDVMMTGMDGFALCRALKGDAALNHIPVILLTAQASEDGKLEGLTAGADDYLEKPFNARELCLRVENLLEVRRLLRQRFSGEVVLKPVDVAVPSADAALMERAHAFVEAHMGACDFEVAQAADAVGMSPRQFRRKIRDITGLSPAGYVRALRLQRAAQLLEKQVGTVSEVAYAVGFQDAKHFSRLFRQVYGVLPSAYGRSGGQSG